MHTGSKMYFVLGIEPFGCAEVWGVHDNKQKATQQAQLLNRHRAKLCCQRYEAIRATKTEIKRRKLELYA